MSISVFLDACVLVPIRLCDLLLSLAEADFFTPRWSADVLSETRRALVDDIGLTAAQADRRITQMQRAFPLAEVDGYSDLVSAMKNNRKDRHVLAAAVRSGAPLLLTQDYGGFPEKATLPYGIEVVFADGFLVDQVALDVDAFLGCLEQMAARLNQPSKTALQIMQDLRPVAPNAAQTVGSHFLTGEPLNVDPPVTVQVPADDMPSPFAKKEEIDFHSPKEVGTMWWIALMHLPDSKDVLDVLSLRPAVWKGYRNLEWLVECSLLTGVEYAIEAPDDIAYLRFRGGSGTSEQVLAPGLTTMRAILTLVRAPEIDEWRVFALGDHFIPATEVYTTS